MLKEPSNRVLRIFTSKTSLSLIDQVIVSGTRFATTVLVGRLGSEAELGVYSLAFSILVFVFGLQESLISIPYTIFVKRLDRLSQRKYAASAFVQTICLNAIAMTTLFIGCIYLMMFKTSSGFGWVFAVLAVMMPFMLLREFARRFTFAHLNMRSVLALDICVSIIQLAGLGLLAWGGRMTAPGAFLATGIASGIGGLAWLYFWWSNLQWDRQRFSVDLLKNWSFGKWVAATNLVSVLHMYFVHWLLVSVYDERTTGIFSACLTVVVLANPFILGITNVLSPKAAHVFAEEGAAAVGKIVWSYVGIIVSVLGPFAVLAGLFGNEFIVWVFKEKYSGNDASIILLAIGTIALGVSFAVGNGLRAIDRPQTNFWAGILGLLVTATVSSLLVTYQGIFGATIGLVAGFYAMTVYRVFSFQWIVKQLTAEK